MRVRQTVFVDTSAWYALASDRDANHLAALRRLQRVTEQGRRLITTNHVIGESYTLVQRRLGMHPARTLLRQLRDSAIVKRVFVAESWEEEAERLLEQYEDQPFGYVDATSFVTMRQLRIQEAFAFDHGFLVVGFVLVGDDG